MESKAITIKYLSFITPLSIKTSIRRVITRPSMGDLLSEKMTMDINTKKAKSHRSLFVFKNKAKAERLKKRIKGGHFKDTTPYWSYCALVMVFIKHNG